MVKIKKIIARQILDGRGWPTIEGKLILDNDLMVEASIPTSQNITKFEGKELRDGEKPEFEGLGVSQAVFYINNLISPKLAKVDPLRYEEIDEWLKRADGTEDFHRLGVNTVGIISQLVWKAASCVLHLPFYQFFHQVYCQKTKIKNQIEKLPAPIFSIFDGGSHGAKNLEFQEFYFIPASSFSFSKALEKGVVFYQSIKEELLRRDLAITIGEEGGYSPSFISNSDALEIMKMVLLKKRWSLGIEVFLGLDLSASDFYYQEKYQIKDFPHPLKLKDYLNYLINLTKEYHFLLLEDPLYYDDFSGWSSLNQQIGETTYLVADELVGGNRKRLEKAIKQQAISALVIKFNQFPTISDILETVILAKNAEIKIIFSHQFGETNDWLIADLAVGFLADFVKFGAPCRGERISKYNRLLAIEKELKFG